MLTYYYLKTQTKNAMMTIILFHNNSMYEYNFILIRVLYQIQFYLILHKPQSVEVYNI